MRRRLVDVDASHGCGRSRVASVVDAVAAVRDGLAAAFPTYGAAGHRIACDAGLDWACVSAGEGDGNVGVVPAVGVRLWVAAAADVRRRLVDVDAADRRGGSGVAGLVRA